MAMYTSKGSILLLDLKISIIEFYYHFTFIYRKYFLKDLFLKDLKIKPSVFLFGNYFFALLILKV